LFIKTSSAFWTGKEVPSIKVTIHLKVTLSTPSFFSESVYSIYMTTMQIE